MSYRDDVARARRLSILQLLYFAADYVLPRTLLCEQLCRTGYMTSRDLLDTELAWLAEQGLVDALELDVVRLTQRGQDVAFGRSETPGVRRPGPNERIGNGT